VKGWLGWESGVLRQPSGTFEKVADVSPDGSVVIFTPAFPSLVLLPPGIFQDTFAGMFASSNLAFFEIRLGVASLLPQALLG
jgi:hypothetical protein